MGKMVDKQLQIIDEAQQKAENFLKKKIKLDILPEKGWESEDMFVPPGYHLDTEISDEGGSPKEAEPPAYNYPAGLGNVLMNGCYGTGYKPGDPCYVAKWTLDACLNMIDGAAFMGVGFDGRGEYSPESRKMSIVQRSCAGKSTYDDFDVPDTMNVHGIYDTKATMMTFESRSEFQSYEQQEAGVSGSYFGFYAGAKTAWGESSSSASQKYMAQLSVDINRYEVFLDEVKPQDVSLSFLREFMELPTSYFAAGGPLKYQNFIQRWGTHYIKSSKFGGQLQIRKFMDATDVSSKKEFAVEMEMEFKSLFASVGAKASAESGESSRRQSKTTSTTVIALGGSHEVASILSDAYSPSFKNAFKDWLASIPQYPKPFLFQVSPLTDLLNFKMRDLFPDEKVHWGCEGHAAGLTTETNANGDKVTFFEAVNENGTKIKHYCLFESRKGLEEAIKRRRISLKRAIEVYMEEGPTSISDFSIPECKKEKPSGQKPNLPTEEENNKRSEKPMPTWQSITSGHKEFRVIFDMKKDLTGIEDYTIPRNMNRLMRFVDGKWQTGEGDGTFHLYNAFNNGRSGEVKKRKISVLGLVLSYNEDSGGLDLLTDDIKYSKKFFPNLPKTLTGRTLAKLVLENGDPASKQASKRQSESTLTQPCNVEFSNALRFDPTDTNGKCLHFTAATEGSIFVVFSTLPKDSSSWYYTEITPQRVAIYKGRELQTSTVNPNARGLGDANLLQSYFVCITETDSSTLIEYGKTLGTTESGDIYLNRLDTEQHLNVRFYAFGNGDKKVDIIDAHIVSRDLTTAICKGDTYMDYETMLCTQRCHEDCDPLHGCNTKTPGNPLPSECNQCRVAADLGTDTYTCLPECKEPNFISSGYCVGKEATFDLEPGVRNEGEKILSVSEIPHLASFSLCLWLRFLNKHGGSGNWDMVRYYTSGSRVDGFGLKWVYHADEMHLSVQLVALTKGWHKVYEVQDRVSSANYLDDLAWHHYCLTFSGESGLISQYADGKKVKSETGIPMEIEGGGALRIGYRMESHRYQMSGLNLWDKVLPPEEISDMATSCVKGMGNVKNWYHFSDAAKAMASMNVITPSVCRAPVQHVTETEIEEASTGG
ncbi:uncharacterized protein [Montipora capricornis]|uniref:uncharacterized protein n=1 Tax=Montipora capricornis TaxID=246305 RepID=UPI0035F1C3EB